jgi:hypothetical protein
MGRGGGTDGVIASGSVTSQKLTRFSGRTPNGPTDATMHRAPVIFPGARLHTFFFCEAKITMKKNLASTFALSAAALFLSSCGKEPVPTTPPEDATKAAPTADADPNAKQRCYAVNECAGQTACDVTGKWECGGNNDCCGKGWLSITKSECDALGGSDDEALLANPPIDCAGKPAPEADPAAT